MAAIAVLQASLHQQPQILPQGHPRSLQDCDGGHFHIKPHHTYNIDEFARTAPGYNDVRTPQDARKRRHGTLAVLTGAIDLYKVRSEQVCGLLQLLPLTHGCSKSVGHKNKSPKRGASLLRIIPSRYRFFCSTQHIFLLFGASVRKRQRLQEPANLLRPHFI